MSAAEGGEDAVAIQADGAKRFGAGDVHHYDGGRSHRGSLAMMVSASSVLGAVRRRPPGRIPPRGQVIAAGDEVESGPSGLNRLVE